MKTRKMIELENAGWKREWADELEKAIADVAHELPEEVKDRVSNLSAWKAGHGACETCPVQRLAGRRAMDGW